MYASYDYRGGSGAEPVWFERGVGEGEEKKGGRGTGNKKSFLKKLVGGKGKGERI